MSRTFRHPWYVRLVVGAVLGLVAVLIADHTIFRADASVLLHDPLLPAQRTCDDPENPCYTAPQMVSYLQHDTHGFHHLSPTFPIPTHFRDLAIRAHRQGVQQGIYPDTPGWWAQFRDDIHCAGGTGEIYWGCPGGVNEHEIKGMEFRLNHTDKVVLFCAGTAAFGFWRGGFWGGVGGGGFCFMGHWLGV